MIGRQQVVKRLGAGHGAHDVSEDDGVFGFGLNSGRFAANGTADGACEVSFDNQGAAVFGAETMDIDGEPKGVLTQRLLAWQVGFRSVQAVHVDCCDPFGSEHTRELVEQQHEPAIQQAMNALWSGRYESDAA